MESYVEVDLEFRYIEHGLLFFLFSVLVVKIFKTDRNETVQFAIMMNYLITIN